MTINFPKTLPYPTVQGYAIKPGEAIVRTEMEAGPERQRRRYTQTPSRITVKWIFNLEQFAVFEAWYKYYAQEGGEWFYITLFNGRLWEISSELEIRDRPTLSEDEMDVLTEIDLVTLELWTSKLHILVHSSLPYKLN